MSENVVTKMLKGPWLAAYHALRLRIPFVIYITPGRKRPEFMASMYGHQPISSRRFVIVPWLDKVADGLVIDDTITYKDFLKSMPTLPDSSPLIMSPWGHTTDKLLYKGQVYTIIDLLKEQGGGKTVLSRVISGRITHEDCEKVTLYAFHMLSCMNPDTFRFLYFTPETGAWMAASPELLLMKNKVGGMAMSMALAGTRRHYYLKNNEAWDAKNVYEHDLVLNEICNTLQDVGVEKIEICERNLRYGEIEHRCHDIRFDAAGISPEALLDSLSPTPALGGYPRDSALNMIGQIEIHPRYCYGGYVMLDTPETLTAYVNLRCCHLDRNVYTIYSGGGITPDSKPEDEWKETELKSQNLTGILEISERVIAAFCSKE